MHYIYQSKLIRNTAYGIIANPTKSLSILMGVTCITVGIAYQYGTKILYNLGSAVGIVYGNNQIAKFAIDSNNVGLYDLTTTFSEILYKLSPTWFPKVNSNPALTKGIDEENQELIDTALTHDVQINEEGEKGRPVEQALNKGTEKSFAIAEQLILDGNADLLKSSYSHKNLFHQTIQTGKKELANAAMKQAMEQVQELGNPIYIDQLPAHNVLMRSPDNNNDNIAHSLPASPGLQDEANKVGLPKAFTPKTVSAGNTARKTPVDTALYFYKHGITPAKLVKEYIQKAPSAVVQPHLYSIMQDDKLRDMSNQIVNKDDFNFNLQDSSGHLPIDSTLAFGNDELSAYAAKQTDSNLLENSHLWAAHQKAFKNTKNTLEKKLLTNNEAIQLFIKNPTGKYEGSFFHLMASNRIPISIEDFKAYYNVMTKITGLNPLKETYNGLTVLDIAAKNNNEVILNTIFDIFKKEGIQHLHMLIDPTFAMYMTSHNKIKWFKTKMLNSPFRTVIQSTDLNQIANSAQLKKITYEKTENKEDSFTNNDLEVEISNNNDISQIIKMQTHLIDYNIKKVEKFKIEKQKSKRVILEENNNDDASFNYKEIKLTHIKYVEIQKQKETFIIGGTILKQLAMYKGLFAEIMGVDIEQSFSITVSSIIIFGAGGYAEAYGRDKNAYILAPVSAGIYGIAEYTKGKAYNEYTPPEERDFFDFMAKYGGYIFLNTPLVSILYQMASAIPGGPIGGKNGMLKSLGITLSISTMHSYKIYTTDIDENVNTKLSYFDYFNLENIAATAMTIYVESCYYPVLLASVNNVKTSTTALAIGKLSLNLLSATSSLFSSFYITKLVTESLSFITEPTNEWVLEPLAKNTYKAILDVSEFVATSINRYTGFLIEKIHDEKDHIYNSCNADPAELAGLTEAICHAEVQ